MKIALTGGNGFLGSKLYYKLSQKNFEVYKFDVRNSHKLNLFLKSIELDNFNFVINTAANLYPQSNWDYNINQNLSREIQNKILKKKTKLIHMSTLNVINKQLNDQYTKSKRLAESKLIKNDRTIIIRPSLIIDKNFNISKNTFESYTNIPLFFYPMIFPGSVYNPIFDSKLVDFIIAQLNKKDNSFKIYNIIGKNNYELWEIFNKFCANKNKKAIKVNLNFMAKINNKKLTNFFSKHSFTQNLLQLNGYTERGKDGEDILL